jgi:hypothetical protein
MKEYVKIVQIKKLKMKLTFSLDVQNLVGREMIALEGQTEITHINSQEGKS